MQCSIYQRNSLEPPFLRRPSNGVGRPRSITPPILDTLREYLLGKPELYLDEMAVFLWDEFEVLVTAPTISRTFASIGWSKKTIRRKPGSKTQIYETSTCTICQPFVPTTWFMWTNLGATNGLDSDELDSLLLV